MKFGTVYSYWGTERKCNYEDVAKKVADIGFDVLEVNADHIYHMNERELQELDAIAKGYGLVLTTNSGPAKEYDMSSVNPETRRKGIEYLKTILLNMRKINSPSLVGAVYSFWPTDFVDIDKKALWERSIEGVQELSKTAEELDIEIALEVLNRNETCILTDCEEAIEYCSRIGSDKVKILLDTYHMNIEEDNIQEALKRAGNLLGHVHVGECNRKLPGMNHSIPWDEVGEALRSIHYDKAVVMEPFLIPGGEVGNSVRVWRDLARGATQEQLTTYISDSLQFLKEKLA